MNKPSNHSVTNITGPTTSELDVLLETVLDYFGILCPSEKCQADADEEPILVAFNNRIECNICDEYSTEAFTIKLEFD